MLTGKCPKCGWDFYGWALRFPRNQMCGNCGSPIEIFEDGKKVSDGFSPFDAEEYRIIPNQETPAPGERAEEDNS